MDYWPTLLSSFTGGAVTALGFIFKRSEETRQKYRKLLYELLGIYQAFNSTRELTPSRYIEAFSNAFASLGHPEFQQNKEFQKFLEPFVAPQIEAMLEQLGGWDENNYIASIQVIAPVNPVLAHSFKANLLLKNGLSMARNYWQRYLEALRQNGVDPTAIEPMLPVVESRLLEEMLKELKSDINHIAKLAGIREQWRTKRWFKRRNEPLEKTLLPFAEQILSEISIENVGRNPSAT